MEINLSVIYYPCRHDDPKAWQLRRIMTCKKEFLAVPRTGDRVSIGEGGWSEIVHAVWFTWNGEIHVELSSCFDSANGNSSDGREFSDEYLKALGWDWFEGLKR